MDAHDEQIAQGACALQEGNVARMEPGANIVKPAGLRNREGLGLGFRGIGCNWLEKLAQLTRLVARHATPTTRRHAA